MVLFLPMSYPSQVWSGVSFLCPLYRPEHGHVQFTISHSSQPNKILLLQCLREQDIITKKEAEMFEFERILEQNKITLEQKEKELFSQKAEVLYFF